MDDMEEYDRQRFYAEAEKTLRAACEMAAVIKTHAALCQYGTALLARFSEETRAWSEQHEKDDKRHAEEDRKKTLEQAEQKKRRIATLRQELKALE